LKVLPRNIAARPEPKTSGVSVLSNMPGGETFQSV
jgi:hypothetical protein